MNFQQLFHCFSKVILLVLFLCLFVRAQQQPGTLDTSWNGSGKSQTAVSASFGTIGDMYAYPNGKLIVVGTSYVSGNDSQTTVVRYNSDGALDNSFGANGILNFNFNLLGAIEEGASAIAVYPATGKIAVLSEHNERLANGATRRVLLIYSLNANGGLDNGFGTNGYVTFAVSGNSSETGADIAFSADGRIYVLGSTLNGGATSAVLLRLNADGSLDTTFAAPKGFLSFVPPALERALAAKMAIQTDGKIVVVGGGFAPNSFDKNSFVARFNNDATPDANFNTNGFRVIDFSPNGDQFNSVAVAPNGDVYAAGDIGNRSAALVARFNSAGAFYNSFGANGAVVINGTNSESGLKIALTGNNKILITFGKDDGDFHIFCLNESGAPEMSFGANGEAVASLTDNTNGYDLANALAFANNKVYIAGGADGDTDNITRFGIARFFAPAAATATAATISGRVLRGESQGLRNVLVELVNPNTGITRQVVTNSFGYYRFNDLPVGASYLIRVSSPRYKFRNPTIAITINGNLDDVNFYAY
jgi:uncharacterized delta-60 repeat protein